MPRRVVNIVTYNELEWFIPNYKEIYPVADIIIITEGGIINWAKHPHSSITYEFLSDNDPENKIRFAVKNGFWASFEECFNARTRFLHDGDLLLILNSDELVHADQAAAAFNYLEQHPECPEVVPVFLHFWRDFYHILKPERHVVNITHQRCIRFQDGYHWSCHHPTACDKNHTDTVWLEPYSSKRVLATDWYIYHYNYLSDPARFREKLIYCAVSGIHGNIFDGNISFATDQADNCNRFTFKENQQTVLDFDGIHPAAVNNHKLYGNGYHDDFLKNFNHLHWKDTPEYGKGEIGTIYDRGY